jgi:hypothetical protein
LSLASAKQARAEGLREEKEGATLESLARAKQESRHPSLLLNQDQELLQELKVQEVLLQLKLQELLLRLKLQDPLLRLKVQELLLRLPSLPWEEMTAQLNSARKRSKMDYCSGTNTSLSSWVPPMVLSQWNWYTMAKLGWALLSATMKGWQDPTLLCKCQFVNVEVCLPLSVSPHQTIATIIKTCSGSPDSNEVPRKYRLGTDADLMSDKEQTLTEASVEFVNGQTVMKFTKPMVEDNQISVTVGVNKMLWAHGDENTTTIGYHGDNKNSFTLDLSSESAPVTIPSKG